MRFLFVSDLHNGEVFIKRLKEVAKKADVVINCGDICGAVRPFRTTHPLHLQAYIEALEGFEHYFILGNDDYVFETHPRRLTSLTRIGDIWIFPFEYVPITPFNTNREKSEEELREMLSHANPPSPFIFVSHAPPFGILDVGGRSMKHLGSVAIREFVFSRRPILHAFGHIHESPGCEIWDGIYFLNNSYGSAHLVEISEGRVKSVREVLLYN